MTARADTGEEDVEEEEDDGEDTRLEVFFESGKLVDDDMDAAEAKTPEERLLTQPNAVLLTVPLVFLVTFGALGIISSVIISAQFTAIIVLTDALIGVAYVMVDLHEADATTSCMQLKRALLHTAGIDDVLVDYFQSAVMQVGVGLIGAEVVANSLMVAATAALREHDGAMTAKICSTRPLFFQFETQGGAIGSAWALLDERCSVLGLLMTTIDKRFPTQPSLTTVLVNSAVLAGADDIDIDAPALGEALTHCGNLLQSSTFSEPIDPRPLLAEDTFSMWSRVKAIYLRVALQDQLRALSHQFLHAAQCRLSAKEMHRVQADGDKLLRAFKRTRAKQAPEMEVVSVQ